MKKALLLSLLIAISFSAFAQNSSFQPEWAFGINGGPTFSKMRFSPSISQTNLLQYSGGVTVRYISENHFGIQGELNYSMRGWEDLTDDIFLNKYHRSLTYLELPLMTHLYFHMGKRMRVVFNVGPQIAYNLSEKWEMELYNGSEAREYYELPIQRKFDYGVKGGIGFELRTGVGSFVLEGRYYFGLSDIFNNKKKDYFAASSHQVLGINLTYLIRK